MDLDRCGACVHHCNIIQRSFTALKTLCAPPVHTPSRPWPLAATCLLTVSIVCLFRNVKLDSRSFVAFSDWLFMWCLMFLFMAVAHFFLVLNNTPLSGWTSVYLSICLLKGHLGCFQVLAVRSKVAVNIHVQGFVRTKIFIYLGNTTECDCRVVC